MPNQGWNVTDLYLNQKNEFGEVVGYEFEYWFKKIESLIGEVNKINDKNFYPINSYKLFCKNISNFSISTSFIEIKIASFKTAPSFSSI